MVVAAHTPAAPPAVTATATYGGRRIIAGERGGVCNRGVERGSKGDPAEVAGGVLLRSSSPRPAASSSRRMPWWAWIPLRSVSTVPLVGIGLCAAGLLYGTYDLTEKVARRVIPNRHRTSTTSNAVGWLAATAGAGATFQVGEALFRPAPVPPPKLSGGASMDARVRDFSACGEPARIRGFPARETQEDGPLCVIDWRVLRL